MADIYDVHDRCKALEARLFELGFRRPTVTLRVTGSASPHLLVLADFGTHEGLFNITKEGPHKTATEAFEAAETWVENLPPAKSIAEMEITKEFRRLQHRAAELGIDVHKLIEQETAA